MIAHHQGGIHMAQYAARPRQRDRGRRFAYGMVKARRVKSNELRGLIAV